MEPAREAGCYRRNVARAEVLTLLETHVGHGVIHSPEGRNHYVRTAHPRGKGTGTGARRRCCSVAPRLCQTSRLHSAAICHHQMTCAPSVRSVRWSVSDEGS